MSIYFNNKDNFLDSSYFNRLPNEDKLTIYDNLIIQNSEALKEANNNPYSRMPNETKYNINQDLKRIHERRNLLIESMGVLNTLSNHASNQNFVNSQIHFGQGNNILDKSKDTQDYNKEWYEKPLGIVTLTVIAGVIIGGIIYFLKWN